MAFSDKELEDQLVEVGSRLASSPASVEDILPILDQLEGFLSRIEQSPSDAMLTALDPSRKALIAKELLGHSDLDVKAAVASCISEITRITAPEAPYDDDLMKEAFQLIVEAFEKLDDTSSRSHTKRISILETVAKVRSCVVMLDLECDSLILEMFGHFLRTIRPSHSESVFSSMETIMTLVIEESEDISSGLLSCLLHTVKKENKDILPIAHRLAEKVISNTAIKLRPYLVELSQSSLSEYGDVVLSIFKKNAENLELNDTNASSECLADDSKFSERTVSDELPQGSVILEPEVVCPEDGPSADKSPRSVMCNGTAPIGNAEPVVEPTSSDLKHEHAHHTRQSNDAAASIKIESENLDSVTRKEDSVEDKNPKNSKPRKVNTANISGANDHSHVENDKEVSAMSSREESGPKEASANGPSCGVAESELYLESDKKDELQPPIGSGNGTTSGDWPANKDESSPDATRPRRGRPPGTKLEAKRGAGRTIIEQSVSVKKGASSNDRSVKESLSDQDSKKESNDSTDSEEEAMKHSSKKVDEDDSDDQIIAAKAHINVEKKRSSISKTPKGTGKNGSKGEISERPSLGKQQRSNNKSRKGKTAFAKDPSELSLKEIVSSSSSATKSSSKDQNHLDEGIKPKSRRKRALGADEISEILENKELDENVVGSRIKVWWPYDKKFYHGVVESFNPASKQHEVVYDDGDIEHLVLKDERWEFIEDDNETPTGKAKNARSPDTAEMQRNKRARRGSDSLQNMPKRGRPRKGDGLLEGKSSSVDLESASKRGNDTLKRARMRKSTGGTPKASGKLRDDKSGSKLKDESVTPKAVSKSKDEAVASKSNEGTPNDGRKRKAVSTPGSGRSVKVNGASGGKSKGKERGDSASEKTPNSEAGIASKRRRKGGS